MNLFMNLLFPEVKLGRADEFGMAGGSGWQDIVEF
jgi:hypothetical protein